MNASPHDPALDPADARWAALAEAETLGQPLAPHDLQFLRLHVPSDPVLRAEHAMRWALGGWGEGATDGEDDEAVIAAAVGAHVHGVGERKGRRAAWIAGAAGLAAAAAVVLVVLARPGEPVTPEVASVEGGAARESGEDEGARSGAGEARVPEEAGAAEAGALRSLSGTWVDEGGLALAGTPAPGTVLTATSEACLGDAVGGRLCVRPGARVRAVAADRPAIEWLEGSGELTLPRAPASVAGAPAGSLPQARVIELRVAGAAVTGAAASIAVESTLEGRWTLVVREGEVELHTAEGKRSLVAGDRWSPDEPLAEAGPGSSRAATPDAATLLRRARTARAGGEMAEAAALYRRLLDVYPRSTSAGPALVALGQVELARGRARAALDAFDRYLERGGPLAEEAAYGRIEALRKLGRAKEEKAAIERFLAKYPGSSYAAKLQRRP